jgi:hypothetical protein
MNRTSITKISERKQERGSVLAYTVISILFLFLAVGLGVDLSHFYLAKAELQNSADAAALAGASAMTLPITDANSQPYRIPEAVNRALLVLNRNKYNFNNKNYVDVMTLADQRALVRFAKNLSEFDNGGTGRSEATAIAAPDDIRFVRVITPSVPINIFFSIPILGVTQNLDAKAVSGMSVPGNLSVCIAPLSAVACTPNDPTCSLCDPGDPLYPNCTWSKYWGNCGGADPYAPLAVTVHGPDDPDGDGFCNPKKEYCQTCKYNIRSEGQNQQGPNAGNFQILACAGQGNAVRDALATYGTNCNCGRVSPGSEVETQTGVAAGIVRDGLNVRFDQYSGGLSYGPTMPPDSNIQQGTPTGNGSNTVWPGINYQQYQGLSNPVIAPVGPSQGETGVANRRVLIIPIIPMSEFTDSTGHQTVHVGSLGGFFMQAQVSGGNGGDIQVEYIGDKITGVIGYDPNDNNITNIVTPVIYR